MKELGCRQIDKIFVSSLSVHVPQENKVNKERLK